MQIRGLQKQDWKNILQKKKKEKASQKIFIVFSDFSRFMLPKDVNWKPVVTLLSSGKDKL